MNVTGRKRKKKSLNSCSVEKRFFFCQGVEYFDSGNGRPVPDRSELSNLI